MERIYLDNIVPGDHGAPKPFLFFLTRKYWGLPDKKKSEDPLAVPLSQPNLDVDVQEVTKN